MASIPLDFPAAAKQQQRSAAWLAALDALDLVCLRTAALDVVLEGGDGSRQQGWGFLNNLGLGPLGPTAATLGMHSGSISSHHVHTLGCTRSHDSLISVALIMSQHAPPPRCHT